MSYLTEHWSFDPFLILAVVVAVWHEVGLGRLARRSRPERTRERRLRSLWFYAGLAVLLLAVESPIDYWADDYFFVHMIQHLLLMFAAPSLIVAGAPWQPLLDALPGRSGRSVTRGVLAGGWSRPLRAAGGFFLRPWVAVALFNAVMIVWHLPGPYRPGREQPGRAHLADARQFLRRRGAVLAAVHPVAAVPPADAAGVPGGRAARHQRGDDRPRHGAEHLRPRARCTRSTTTCPASPCRRSPTSRSARRSCGCAATSGPCPR